MTTPEVERLAADMTAHCRKGPFYFYDLVREFPNTPYRQILAAWGLIRERVAFERDDPGHYIYTEKNL
jgi:hypothetical protein